MSAGVWTCEVILAYEGVLELRLFGSRDAALTAGKLIAAHEGAGSVTVVVRGPCPLGVDLFEHRGPGFEVITVNPDGSLLSRAR